METSSLTILPDPSTIGIPISTQHANQDIMTQQTQAPTNIASKDILPQQTQAPTNLVSKDILPQLSQASINHTNQDIAPQQSDYLTQGIKFKNLIAVDEVDKYRNKALKGKDIVREENAKPKDKKKDGTIHSKS